MKTKMAVALIIIVATLGLTGCKPKTTKISGQIFIVTRGGENFKLGDVQILLIDKSQVVDFLQKQSIIIQNELDSRKRVLADAEKDFKKAQTEFNAFLISGHPATNADLLEITKQLNEVLKQHKALERQWYSVDSQQSQATAQGWSARADALLNQEQVILDQEKQTGAEAESLMAKLDSVVALHKAEETNKFETAKSNVAFSRNILVNSPTAEDYFASFQPTIVQQTLSDADGKFSFTYLHDKPLTIYAYAERTILNGTEKYYWLIDAPTNAKDIQVFLSNDKLVYVDPDGYFKIKPKQQRIVDSNE